MRDDRARVRRLLERTTPPHPKRLEDVRARASRRERRDPAPYAGLIAFTALVVAAALVAINGPGARPERAATESGADAADAPSRPAVGPARLSGAYVTAGPDGGLLLPIDARTLADDGGRSAVSLADPSLPATSQVLSSTDGSTVAVVPARGGGPALVLRARTGGEPSRFGVPPAHYPAGLSADGSRLLLREGEVKCDRMGCTPVGFRVVDTSSGAQAAVVSDPDPQRRWWGAHISPDGRRLYALLTENSPRVTASVAVYDLPSGRKLRSADMGTMIFGDWPAPAGARVPVTAGWRSGSALSPDGSVLAVVHADRDAVTLVDTRSLRARTAAVTRVGPFSKSPPFESASLWAKFSPDGATLYVSGVMSGVGSRGQQVYIGLGLQAIDVRSGRVVVALEGKRAVGVEFSPDGRALYAFAPAAAESDDCPCSLYRLDAEGLRVTSSREFDTLPEVHLFGPEAGQP